MNYLKPWLIVLCVLVSHRAIGALERFAGADVSMLLDIEKAGGVYRDGDHAGTGDRDAIAILKDHGCNLFRLRLFVDPVTDFKKAGGATQNLDAVKQLAKRIKAVGGSILLDIHYSDTWADPMHQRKPKAWETLSGEALEKKVYEYTRDVLAELKKDDLSPVMVQVGNEITAGVLWPHGKVLDVPKDQETAQWGIFAKLLNAGCRAVRDASTAEHPIKIAIHIHGGGRPGLPQWFFGKFDPYMVDYDIIALSFYPQWGDSLEELKKNLAKLSGKEVLLAEVSYPWKEIDGIKDKSLMQWPMTPAGQVEFVAALNDLIVKSPELHVMGYVWWYPEAIPVPDPSLHIWKGGGEALFDDKGQALPAMGKFGDLTK